MREGLLCVLLLWIMCGCGENKRGKVELKDLSFQCKITEPQIGEKLLLEINGKEQAFPVPADGVVDIKVPRIVPQYSSVTYGRKYYPLYLMGGGLMQMEFSGDLDNWRRTFSGNGKEINEYLSSSIIPFESSDFVKNENDLKEVTEKLFAQNIKNLESRKLPKSFENLERERLRYYAYGSWNSYRLNHRWMVGDENFEPSDAYYATMRELGKEKPELRELEIYRKFLRNTVEVMVNRGAGQGSPEKQLEAEIAYIRGNYKDSVLLEDLMHHFIYKYVADHGVGEKKELVQVYRRYVKDQKRSSDFDRICATWEKLQPGNLSVSFNFIDAVGNYVALESLRGKYVYIDLWASWCGPCRREIPFLKKLEERFKGKDVVFVSISCDKDVEAWKKAMKEEKVTGIQLHMGKDMSFAKAYVLSGIPRFILLDKEGRIVDARMTKPSDPKTEKTLQALL